MSKFQREDNVLPAANGLQGKGSTASTDLVAREDEQSVEVVLPNGKIVGVDASISQLAQAINNGGFETIASCSGHGFRPGNIALCDGRELIIARDFVEARRIDRLFPLDINGKDIVLEQKERPKRILPNANAIAGLEATNLALEADNAALVEAGLEAVKWLEDLAEGDTIVMAETLEAEAASLRATLAKHGGSHDSIK